MVNLEKSWYQGQHKTGEGLFLRVDKKCILQSKHLLFFHIYLVAFAFSGYSMLLIGKGFKWAVSFISLCLYHSCSVM